MRYEWHSIWLTTGLYFKPGLFKNLHLEMVKVGDSNNFHQPFVHRLFHGRPGIHEIFLTGNHVDVLIQREKVFPRLEAHGPVDEVEVQVIQLQVAERLLAGSFHRVLVVICAPQLADDEEVLIFHNLLLQLHVEGQTHLILILVHVGTVNVTVPRVNRHLHSLCHFTWRGLPGAQPQDGHLGAV